MNPMPSHPMPAPFSAAPWAAPSDWSVPLARGKAAHRDGQLLTAMSFYRQALARARQALDSPQPEVAGAAVGALVSGSEGLAVLNEEQDRPDLAVQVLSALHETLLAMVRDDAPGTPRRRAALWHSQCSHGALVALAEAYGWSPEVEAAVRRGCLAFTPLRR